MEEFIISAIIISLLMTIGWTVFNFPRKLMCWLSFIFVGIIFALMSAMLLSNTKSIYIILTDFFFYPMICACVFLFAAVIFSFFDIRGKNIIFPAAFGSNLFLLLFGLEFLKISINIWKSLLPLIASLEIITAFLILQAVTYLSPAKTVFGILKLIAGIASFVILLLQYLHIVASIRGDSTIGFINIVILASTILIIEGLLLTYKASREKLPKIEITISRKYSAPYP